MGLVWMKKRRRPQPVESPSFVGLHLLDEGAHAGLVDDHRKDGVPGDFAQIGDQESVVGIYDGDCQHTLRGTNDETPVLLHDFEGQDTLKARWYSSQRWKLWYEIAAYTLRHIF